MYFLHLIPLFAVIAYYDWKSRDIPEWAIALSWLVYGLSFAFFPNDLGMMLIMLIIPIFGIGLFWSLYLIIEEIYHRKILPQKLIRKFRYGQADVFILPLMLSIILQFGIGIGVLWAVATFGWASLWFNDLKPGDIHRKNGIPILTFALISMVFCIIMVWIDVSTYLNRI